MIKSRSIAHKHALGVGDVSNIHVILTIMYISAIQQVNLMSFLLDQ